MSAASPHLWLAGGAAGTRALTLSPFVRSALLALRYAKVAARSEVDIVGCRRLYGCGCRGYVRIVAAVEQTVNNVFISGRISTIPVWRGVVTTLLLAKSTSWRTEA
jgi:hypothetical protein